MLCFMTLKGSPRYRGGMRSCAVCTGPASNYKYSTTVSIIIIMDMVLDHTPRSTTVAGYTYIPSLSRTVTLRKAGSTMM